MAADFRISLTIACIASFVSFTQAQRIKILADRAFDQMQYSSADSLYTIYFEKYGDTSSLIKRAYCHNYQGKYIDGISFFERTGKWVYKEVKWCTDYARSLQLNAQADSSVAVAQRCLTAFGFSDKLSQIISSQSMADPSTTDNLPLLTEIPFDDHDEVSCPIPYKDKIIFTAPGSSNNIKDPWTGLPFYRLYVGDAATRKSKSIEIEMATEYHVGSAALYDDKLMYFTSNSLKPSKYHEHNLHIAMAGKTSDGKWVHSGIFPYSSPEFSTAYPCFSDNDSIMIFSADMQGGKGGFDLYMCTWELGKWAVPKHLSNICTDGLEIFPWIEGNHTLYFASDGLMGAGGLDIFKVNISDLLTAIPINLGKPYNSAADDFSYVLQGEKAYLCSNRFGKDKIYIIQNIYSSLKH